ATVADLCHVAVLIEKLVRVDIVTVSDVVVAANSSRQSPYSSDGRAKLRQGIDPRTGRRRWHRPRSRRLIAALVVVEVRLCLYVPAAVLDAHLGRHLCQVACQIVCVVKIISLDLFCRRTTAEV